MKKLIIGIICSSIICLIPLSAQSKDLGDALATFLTRKAKAECTLSTDISKVMDDLKTQTDPIDDAVQESFVSIVSILSDEKEAKAFKKEINTILNNKKTTEEEKNKLFVQKMTDYLAKIKKDRKSMIITMKNLPKEKKEELKNQISIMEKNSKEYLKLGKQSAKISSKLLKNASRSDDLSAVVTNINETAVELKDKAKSSLTLAGQVKLLSKLAGI